MRTKKTKKNHGKHSCLEEEEEHLTLNGFQLASECRSPNEDFFFSLFLLKNEEIFIIKYVLDNATRFII